MAEMWGTARGRLLREMLKHMHQMGHKVQRTLPLFDNGHGVKAQCCRCRQVATCISTVAPNGKTMHMVTYPGGRCPGWRPSLPLEDYK